MTRERVQNGGDPREKHLKLINCRGVLVGGNFFTPGDLTSPPRLDRNPSLGLTGLVSDEGQIFHYFSYHDQVPFTLNGTGQTLLRAKVRRLPFRIQERIEGQAFGIRIYPVKGRLTTVRVGKSSYKIDQRESGENFVAVDVGRHNLRVEVIRQRDDERLKSLIQRPSDFVLDWNSQYKLSQEDWIVYLKRMELPDREIADLLDISVRQVKYRISERLIPEGKLESRHKEYKILTEEEIKTLNAEILRLWRNNSLDYEEIAMVLKVQKHRVQKAIIEGIESGKIKSQKGRKLKNRQLLSAIDAVDPKDTQKASELLSQVSIQFYNSNRSHFTTPGKIASDAGFNYRADPSQFIRALEASGLPVVPLTYPRRRGEPLMNTYNVLLAKHSDWAKRVFEESAELQKYKRK